MKKIAPLVVSQSDARRLLMAGAGLLHDPSKSPPPLKLIRHLGFIQLDSINVVERAHELILHTRSDAYQVGQVFRDLRRRKLFEHWTHDASLIPVEHYSHWHHRFERFKTRGWHLSRLGPGADKLVPQILARIRSEGPLMSRDFENPSEGRKASGGWWNWKPAKAVLEYLWRTGQLVVCDRRNFQKVYDLPERVFASAPPSTLEEHVEWACSSALDRLGIATPAELSAFYATIDLAAARRWVHEGLKSGRLIPVELDGRLAIATPDVPQRIKKLPDPPAGLRLLAPFDPLIRDRARAERLFNFHYRFEAFVPEAKRLHGYYVLPILRGDQLIGRVSPKFDRDKGLLQVKLLPWEPGIRNTKALRAELDGSLYRIATFIGASRVDLAS